MGRPKSVGLAALAVCLPQEVCAISKMEPLAVQEAGGGIDDKIEALRRELEARMQAMEAQVRDLQEQNKSLRQGAGDLQEQNKALAKR